MAFVLRGRRHPAIALRDCVRQLVAGRSWPRELVPADLVEMFHRPA